MVFAASGCWQEIEYVAQPETPTPAEQAVVATEPSEPSATPVEPTDEQHDRGDELFADEFASTPADEPLWPDEPDRETEPEIDSPPPVVEPTEPAEPSDRYAMPFETEPIETEPSEDSLFDLFDDPPADEPEEASVEPTDDPIVVIEEAEPPLVVPPPEPTPPTPAATAPSTRRAAWLLGSKFSFATLAQHRGAQADNVANWLAQARALAERFGISLADPPLTSASNDQAVPRETLDYLFATGQQLGREMTTRYGPDHAALVELAVKSNVLVALYRPGSPVADAIATAIREAGPRAELPPHLWQPLLDALDAGAPTADVERAVFQLHREVDRHLAQP